jgi:hypothetical protein
MSNERLVTTDPGEGEYMGAIARGEDRQFLADEAAFLEGVESEQGHQKTRHQKECLRGIKNGAPIKLQDKSQEGDLEASPSGVASDIPGMDAEAKEKKQLWTAMTFQYDLSLHKMWAHLGWKPRYGHMLEKMVLFQQDRRAWTEQRPSSIKWVGTRDFLASSLGGCAPSRITADLNALSELGFVSKHRCGLNSGLVVEIDLDALYSAMAIVGRWKKSDARSLHPPSKQSRPKPDIEAVSAKKNAKAEVMKAKREAIAQQLEETADSNPVEPLFEQTRAAAIQLATRLTNAQRDSLRNRPKYLESIKKNALRDITRCEEEGMNVADVLYAVTDLREEVDKGERSFIGPGFIYDRAKGIEKQRLWTERADKKRNKSGPKRSNDRFVGDAKDWAMNTAPIKASPDEFEDPETGYKAMKKKPKTDGKPVHVSYGEQNGTGWSPPAGEEIKRGVRIAKKGTADHERALAMFSAHLGEAKP